MSPNSLGSFNVQQNNNNKNSYTIMPGDSFRTTCFYRDGSKFGLGSQEEMCIGYIMYYPAKQLMGIPFICPYHDIEVFSVCKQEVGNIDLDSVEDLGRTFGQSSAQCFEPTTDGTFMQFNTHFNCLLEYYSYLYFPTCRTRNNNFCRNQLPHYHGSYKVVI